MRALMGLVKDRNGTFHAQQRVPPRLQEAVARVLNNQKSRQVFLKKSLGTKDTREANIRAKSVQMGFDQVLQQAEALTVVRPVRASLSNTEIRRMTEHYYASVLLEDDQHRLSGPLDPSKDEHVVHQRFETRPSLDAVAIGELLDLAEDALSADNAEHVREDVTHALETFGISLDVSCADYRKLSLSILREQVKAYQALKRRSEGLPVDTPPLSVISDQTNWDGGKIREALEGWKKERQRPDGTHHEYSRAVDMFIALHGNMVVAAIKRSHVRTFRDALQSIPKVRRGRLRTASFSELVEWGKGRPAEGKVSAGTVNKQLGAVQAVAGWAYQKGLVPDDVPWTDPFRDMKAETDKSSRTSFGLPDLQAIFDAPLFKERKLPDGARGDAGVWLPLLALYTGARQGELAGLRVSDIQVEPTTTTDLLVIVEDKKASRRLKTASSERVVPIHPQLRALGFLDYVATRRRESDNAWLFPSVAPDQRGALSAWSKWWGRYLRTHARVPDTDKVFHSFRHGFKDAARSGGVSQEVHDALTGHANASSVSGGYGAKQMLARFGIAVLNQAIEAITYPGLDLSCVRTTGLAVRPRNNTKPKKD